MSIETASVIGYALMTAGVFYLSKEFFAKTLVQSQEHKEILKWFDWRHFGVGLHLVGVWLLVGFAGLLAVMTSAQAYNDLFEGLFVVILVTAGAYTVGYLGLYIIYFIKNQLSRFGRI